MSDLIDFLNARLQEDEDTAQAADVEVGGTWTIADNVIWGTWPGEVRLRKGGEIRAWNIGRVEDAPAAAHITRHDPDRVLREVAAKRAILKHYKAAVRRRKAEWKELSDWAAGKHPKARKGLDGPGRELIPGLEEAVRQLAAAYSDHPDFRTEWSA